MFNKRKSLALHCLTLAAFFFISVALLHAEHMPISVSGVVRDRDGAAIAGAKVFVLDVSREWATKTDEQGKFVLNDVSSEGSFLFIQQAGFRFHGEALAQADTALDRTLIREQEKGESKTVESDAELSDEKREQLVQRVFQPFLNYAVASENDRDKLVALSLLAHTDPARTLELLEKQTFKDPQMAEAVRGKLVDALAAQGDVQAATEIAESFEAGGYVRPFALMLINRTATNLPAAERRALLTRAAVDARALTEPGQRVVLLGLIGEGLLDAGDRAGAEKLLRETFPDAEQLNRSAWNGYARGAFAEELAQIDAAAALSLITDLADADERNRHLGNMAHELAALDPAEAERVLDMIQHNPEARYVIPERDGYAIRVCYRMAGKDLERAMKIADSCTEKNQQAHAYGVMADAIADQDREQATQLLRKAFELLQQGIRDPLTIKMHSAQIAGALLPTAERIDSQLLSEMIWRTVALRTPHADDPQYQLWSNQQTAQLAAWVSVYDRELAASILDQWHTFGDSPVRRDIYATALALSDPQRAVEWAEGLDVAELPCQERYTVARVLALGTNVAEKIRLVHREVGVWRIDIEDVQD